MNRNLYFLAMAVAVASCSHKEKKTIETRNSRGQSIEVTLETRRAHNPNGRGHIPVNDSTISIKNLETRERTIYQNNAYPQGQIVDGITLYKGVALFGKTIYVDLARGEYSEITEPMFSRADRDWRELARLFKYDEKPTVSAPGTKSPGYEGINKDKKTSEKIRISPEVDETYDSLKKTIDNIKITIDDSVSAKDSIAARARDCCRCYDSLLKTIVKRDGPVPDAIKITTDGNTKVEYIYKK